MRSSRTTATGLILVIAACAAVNPAFSSNVSSVKFDDAVKSYKDHKYSQSLTQLQQLHAAGLCNDMVHYYMALDYQAMSQMNSARQEYQKVATGSNPGLKGYAQAALASLDQWSQHRSYDGNGNVFARYSSSTPRAAYSPSSKSGVAKEISFTMQPPAGGGGG